MRVHSIENLELSSLCNNACAYCPASQISQHRYAGIMDPSVFAAACLWLEQLVEEGTQGQLNLFGVGESTLNPRLVDWTREVRRIHPRGHIRLNTNGIVLAQDPGLAKRMKDAGITDIHVTDHDASVTVKALAALHDAGVRYSTNRDFVTGPNNWAGNVDWVPTVNYRLTCFWLARGRCMVAADGRVHNCCIDAFGTGAWANVLTQKPEEVDLQPIELCRTCHHDRI